MSNQEPPPDEEPDEEPDDEEPDEPGVGNVPELPDPGRPDDPLSIPDESPYTTIHPEFSVAGRVPGGEVAVTASNGRIERNGAPSGLFSRLTEQIGTAIQQVGNLFAPPLVVRAEAIQSMTIVFGDPLAAEAQAAFPFHPTRQGAMRIADLIALDDQDVLFGRALELGAGAQGYAELARLVQAEGLTLDWEPLGRPARRLTPERAAGHWQRLSEPPIQREREMHIDGLLYRVIYDGPGHGRVGIRLSRSSPVPPRHRGRTVVVQYDTPEIEALVLHELIGQPIIAGLRVIENAPFTSVLQLAPPYPIIDHIHLGRPYDPMDLFGDDDFDDEFSD